jgi:negative regulator of flagellin synthesis FlgM
MPENRRDSALKVFPHAADSLSGKAQDPTGFAMNTTITPNGLPALPQAKSGQSGNAQPGAPATPDAARAGVADDSVKLTDSARSLQDAARAGNGNEVDTRRVEQLRQALANGTYQVDPGRIADRLTALEDQLASKP